MVELSPGPLSLVRVCLDVRMPIDEDLHGAQGAAALAMQGFEGAGVEILRLNVEVLHD